MKWLDNIFGSTGRDSAYLNWKLLLKATPINTEMLSKDRTKASGMDNSQLIDQDIFEISEANTFDEPMYTLLELYKYLQKFIKNDHDKNNILEMFPYLSHFLDK